MKIFIYCVLPISIVLGLSDFKCELRAQAQLKQWSLPDYVVDFTPVKSSALLPFNIPVTSVSNSIYDKNESLLFYIVDNEIYNSSGTVLDNLQINGSQLQTDRIGQELSIVPVPGSCTRYYIIGSWMKSDQKVWFPFYAEIDMSMPSVANPPALGQLTYFGPGSNIFDLSTISPTNAYDDPLNGSTERNRFGLAVTPFRPGASNYFLYMKGFNTLNLIRYRVESNGIFFDSGASDGGILIFDINPALQDGDNDTYPEMELNASGNTYITANVYDGSRIVLAEFNKSDGTFVNGSIRLATLPTGPTIHNDLKGIEFSLSADFLYYTNTQTQTLGGTTEQIGYVNLTLPILTPVDMSNSSYPGANTLGASFIELGYDGNCYYNDGGNLWSLSSPDSGPSIGNWNAPFPYGASTQLLPDQIDGQDYGDIIEACDTCCTDFMSFLADAQNVQTYGTLGNCNLSFQADGMTDCMQITYFWGDGAGSMTGPITSNNVLVSHTYPGSGTYVICWKIEELSNDSICWEYLHCDTLEILCDSCCLDYDLFCQGIMNSIVVSTSKDSCKTTIDLNGIPECDSIININWGDNGMDPGPFGNNNSPMHVYPNNGVYIISFLALQYSPVTGLPCFEKLLYDTIEVYCDTCFCANSSFTDLFLRAGGAPSIPIQCETSYENLGCPAQGNGFTFTGKFECVGGHCPDSNYVNWFLTKPNGSYVYGYTQANPYCGFNIPPADLSQSGIYTLSLQGFCGGDTCTCEFQFVLDCPNQCPCESEDLVALSAAVNQGFAQLLYPNSCKACFTPIALSDCENVEWYLNSISGSPIGSSIGQQSFCHTFTSGSGTYTIFMKVTRLKPDGTICDTLVKAQTVKISCDVIPGCDNSVFPNPTFADPDPKAGGLNSGGESIGWEALEGDPVVKEGTPGSFDGWSIQLYGNLDTAGVLATTSSICLARDTGMVNLRLYGDPVPGAPDLGHPPRKPCDKLIVQLFQGDGHDIRNCENCFQLAAISLADLDSTDWYDVSIPFDLKYWLSADSCTDLSGVDVRAAAYVTNALGSNQGGPETYSYTQIDNFCLQGTIVGVSNPPHTETLHIYPNPTNGSLTISLPTPAVNGISIRIVDLTGQLILERKAEVGTTVQNLDVAYLPQGMYFLQMMSNGRTKSVNKFVKQ